MHTTVIDAGNGNPILVQEKRTGNGVVISQGRSYVIVGAEELADFVAAVNAIAADMPTRDRRA